MSDYPYLDVITAVDAWFKDNQSSTESLRYWEKLKCLALVNAWIDYDQGSLQSKPKSLALAWEDIAMSFKGYGNNMITGAIRDIVVHLPVKHRRAFGLEVKRILEQVEAKSRAQKYVFRWPDTVVSDAYETAENESFGVGKQCWQTKVKQDYPREIRYQQLKERLQQSSTAQTVYANPVKPPPLPAKNTTDSESSTVLPWPRQSIASHSHLRLVSDTDEE